MQTHTDSCRACVCARLACISRQLVTSCPVSPGAGWLMMRVWWCKDGVDQPYQWARFPSSPCTCNGGGAASEEEGSSLQVGYCQLGTSIIHAKLLPTRHACPHLHYLAAVSWAAAIICLISCSACSRLMRSRASSCKRHTYSHNSCRPWKSQMPAWRWEAVGRAS